MTRHALGLAGSLAVALVACATTPHAHSPEQEEPLVLSAEAADASAGGSQAGDRVVIADPDSGNYFHGYWPVSEEDAERADEGVEKYLRGERAELADDLKGYNAQIFGILDASGHKLIHFNFLCKKSFEDEAVLVASHPDLAPMLDWQHHVLIVNDGGKCYFNLDFDPESGEYKNLIVNGQA